MNTERNEIGFQIIVGILLALSCFLFFQFLFPYHLLVKEQTQLFLFTSDYFISYFSKPAWLACYFGDFLTQFYYLGMGGVAILTLVLVVEWLLFTLVFKRLGIINKAPLIALIPVVIDSLLHCRLDYSLSSTLAVILVLLFFLLYSFISNKWLSSFVGLALMPFLYFVAGGAFILFPLLVIWFEIYQREWKWVYWFLLLGLYGTIPYVTRHHYLLTPARSYQYPNKSLRIDVSLDREDVLSLATESYNENWEKVVELSNNHKSQDPIASYYTNIALSALGELPDKGNQFLSVDPRTSPWLDIFFSGDVYYHLGDMTMAEYLSMLGNMYTPKGRSSRMIKRLAEVHLIMGDSAAARKYLHILENTFFYRKWAEERTLLLAEDANSNEWLKAKRSQIPRYDALRSISDYETILTVLVESNPENLCALNYLLCYYLQNGDLKSFATTFNKYWKKDSEPIPSKYMEAISKQKEK